MPPTNRQYVAAARRLYNDEGTIEVDHFNLETSVISIGSDPGAYVKAWVWVEDIEANQEKDDAEIQNT